MNSRIRLPNPKGRIFAIGDIHGQFIELSILLDHVVNTEKFKVGEDLLVFLGDYIDRGPSSSNVIDILLKVKKELGSSAYFLKGNHESMALGFLGYPGETFGQWHMVNGGDMFYKSYGLQGKVGMCYHTGESIMHLDSPKTMRKKFPIDHLKFLNSLNLMLETDDYIFVHAGLMPGVKVEDQASEDLLWIRNSFLISDLDFGKTVIHGHTSYNKPRFIKSRTGTPKYDRIGIDTKSFRPKGSITCLELPSLTQYSIKNQMYRSCKKVHKILHVD